MFRNMCDNLSTRLKNSLSWGLGGACLGGLTLGTVISLPYCISTNNAYEALRYNFIDHLCQQFSCTMLDWQINSCPGRPNEHEFISELNNQIQNYNQKNYDQCGSDKSNYFITFAVPIGASIGFGLGLIYGFCKSPVIAQSRAAVVDLENQGRGQYVPPPVILESKVNKKELTNSERLEILGISSDEIYNEFKDPITFDIMNKAVLLPCGHGCDESTANQISNCFACRKLFKKTDVTPNFPIRGLIDTFLQEKEKQSESIKKEAESKNEVSESEPVELELGRPLTRKELSEARAAFFGKKLNSQKETPAPKAAAATAGCN